MMTKLGQFYALIPLLVLASSSIGVAQFFDDFVSGRILTSQQQEEALNFVLNKTLGSSFATHGVDSLEDEPAVIEIRDFVSRERIHNDFQFQLNRMLQQLFQDAHTTVEVAEEYVDSYSSIDLCLTWIPSLSRETETEEDDDEKSWDLINTCDTEYAKIGDSIVSMGGNSATQLFAVLKWFIPHENEYYLASLPESWLVREDFLLRSNMVDGDGNVPVVLERDGTVLETIKIPLQESKLAATNETTSSSSFVSYDILEESNTAIFQLDECIYNETYVEVLTEFWTTVFQENNNNIDTVVLDLRNNRGGDFTVAPAFLSYVTTEPYQLFDVLQRTSNDFCQQVPILCDPTTLAALKALGANVTTTPTPTEDYITTIPATVLSAFFGSAVISPVEKVFDGDLYVLISGVTFSSAHLFAGVIQNNGLGTLVGTPTGNTPTFWGNIINFSVPNTDLTLYLTTSQTVLKGREDDAIHPDVQILTTRNDIIDGTDPQLEYVITTKVDSSLTTSQDNNNAEVIDEDDVYPASNDQSSASHGVVQVAWTSFLPRLPLLTWWLSLGTMMFVYF